MRELTFDFTGGLDGDGMTWRGNWIHWETARRLVLNHGAIAPDGLQEPSIPPGWQPEPWDERTASWYIDNVIALTPEDHAIFVEHRLTVEFAMFTLSGQLDCYSISPDGEEFTIDDDKTGVNEVDHAEQNWQLAGYAALLKSAYPKLKRGKIRILQREADDAITEAEVDDLGNLVRYMEQQINAALINRLQLNSSYKACRMCECPIFCPAIREEIKRMKILLTEEQVEHLHVTPDLKQLAEIAAEGRAIAGPIAKLLKTLKARVEREGAVVLEDGTLVKVVNEPGARTITKPKVALALVARKVREETKCPQEDAEDVAWQAMKMSPAAIEEQLVSECEMQRKSVNPEVETAQKWIRQSLGHLIERSTVKELQFK